MQGNYELTEGCCGNGGVSFILNSPLSSGQCVDCRRLRD